MCGQVTIARSGTGWSIVGRNISPMVERGLADLHIHTDHSDGWPDARELVRFVRDHTMLDVIAVTDHDTVEGALRASEYARSLKQGPEVIVGEEVSTRDGHVVGLWLKRRVPPGLTAAATLEQIHEQGGIAFAAHPFWRTDRHGRGGNVHGLGWPAADLAFDAVEVENSTPGFYLFNQMARRLNDAMGCAELGNSDAHILDAVGRAYTTFPGRDGSDLRRAVAAATTTAHRERYRAIGLVRYMAWGLNHQRMGAVGTAGQGTARS